MLALIQMPEPQVEDQRAEDHDRRLHALPREEPDLHGDLRRERRDDRQVEEPGGGLNGGRSGLGLVVRAGADGSRWIAWLSTGAAALELLAGENGDDAGGQNGNQRIDGSTGLSAGQRSSVQIIDDGSWLRVIVDGVMVVDAHDATLGDQRGVGLAIPDGERPAIASNFEAHPRTLACPASLLAPWPEFRSGATPVVDHDFSSQSGLASAKPGADLERFDQGDGRKWRHLSGERMLLADRGATLTPTLTPPTAKLARVLKASGIRSAYSLDWEHPDFADLEVTLVHPGSERGQDHNGRGGLAFWQDDDHALLVNVYLNDLYGGASLSCFFRVKGYEEVYDAVWVNVGQRITWGGTNRLRVAFDGNTWVVWLDGEIMLHRQLRDVYPYIDRWQIHRVGLMTNWEFGNDTGTRFVQFTARH